MSAQSVPAVVIAAITAYVGVYHLVLYLRRPGLRQNLAFALLCGAAVLHDVATALILDAGSSADARPGQEWRGISYVVGGIAIVWLAAGLAERPSRRIPWILTGALTPIGALLLIAPDIFYAGAPLVRTLDVPLLGRLVYRETALSSMALLKLPLGGIVFGYALWTLWRRPPRAMPASLAAFAVLGLSFFHDTLVAQDVFLAPYLMQYAFLALILVMAFSDLSERKRFEDALTRSEEIFSALVRASPMGVYLYELQTDGRLVLVEANPSADRMTGIDNQEQIGKTIEEAFPALAATEIPERYRQAARDGIPWQTQDLFYEDDQIRGAYDVHAFQISPGRMAVMFLDITDRWRSQEETRKLAAELSETSALLETILDAIPDVIGVQDPQHRIIRYNEAGYRFLGTTPEAAAGKTCHELMGRSAACETCAASETLRTGRPARSERYLPDRDLWLDFRSYPVRDADGNTVRVIEHLRDITKEKRAADSLERSEKMFRSYFRKGLIGMAVTSARTRFIDVNERLCQMLGYSRDELLALSWRELSHPEDAREDLLAFRRMIAGEVDEYELERRLRRADGSELRVRLYVTCERDGDGQVDFVIAHVQDVTEQRRAEEALRQAQKMEAVGQLAGGVAHDFNNLLQAIHGYTEIALLRMPPEDPLREHLEEVEKAASRATTLTRQLLTFGRRETLQPRHLDLGAVVTDLLKMLRRVIGEQVELVVHTQPDLRPVHMDRGQVEQVLMNLCLNARDAMPDGGVLTIETGMDRLDDGTEAVLVVIRDTGEGIPAEIQDRIFDPFFTTKEIGAGTGLGLATVYAIVERHRGRIEFESELGAGTAFHVRLPASTGAPDTRPPEVEERPAEGGTETILLAEDDELVRNLAVAILESAGYRLVVARDGAEAIRLLDDHVEEIDLALLDVIMPRQSGRDVHDALRARRPEVPVLFCSGYSYGVLEKGHLPPGEALIRKPYMPQSLLRRVREALTARA